MIRQKALDRVLNAADGDCEVFDDCVVSVHSDDINDVRAILGARLIEQDERLARERAGV